MNKENLILIAKSKNEHIYFNKDTYDLHVFYYDYYNTFIDEEVIEFETEKWFHIVNIYKIKID